jgi:photosystem II stability/assembly factor-like uncharacterized protein
MRQEMKLVISIVIIILFFAGCSTDPNGPEEVSVCPGARSFSVGIPDQVFVSAYNGIYYSANNGDTWKILTNINSGFVSVSPSGTIYSTQCVSKGYGFYESLWRSTDGGSTFQKTGWSNETDDRFGLRWLVFNNQEHIFAGGNKDAGVMRSTSMGDSWEPLLVSGYFNYFGNPYLNALIAPNNIFINQRDGVYRSDNNGDSWIKVFSLPDLGDTSYFYDVLAFNSQGRVYVGINASLGLNPVESGKIYYSDDNGNTWIKVTALKSDITGFAINSNDKLFVVTELMELFSSTNNGIEWNKASLNLTGNFIIQFIICSNKSLFIRTADWNFGGNNRIYRSQDDGVTWEQIWPYY